MALKAGADMVLMPENFEEAYQGVLDAVVRWNGGGLRSGSTILYGEFTA